MKFAYRYHVDFNDSNDGDESARRSRRSEATRQGNGHS